MNQSYEIRLRRVVDHIHNNLAGDLSLDELADVAAMSRFHFHRVFHAVMGTTVAQAIRKIRMYRAACLLVQQDWPVCDVAKQIGYDNEQSFGRAFRQCFGQSPTKFRQRSDFISLPFEMTKGDISMYDIDITTLPTRRIFAQSHIGPYPDISRAFTNLFNTLSSRGLVSKVQGVMAFSYDDPNIVAEAELRSHAGVFVPDGLAVPETLDEIEMIGGRYAILHFKGPYAGLAAAYQYLFGSWLPQSGEELSDAPTAEIYLNNFQATPPDDLLTDICLPLKG